MRQRWIALLAAVLVLPAPALAAVEEVRLQVKGLACPFCTYGIEKNLKKLPGVVSVETTIRTGIVRVQLEAGAALDIEAFRAAVARSGFTFEHLEATVTGRFVQHDGLPALESQPGGQIFLLVGPRSAGTSEELAAGTRDALGEASVDGSTTLEIKGRVHDHPGTLPALSVESFEVAK